jgi:hypothetical protein
MIIRYWGMDQNFSHKIEMFDVSCEKSETKGKDFEILTLKSLTFLSYNPPNVEQ